jgi:hypothetical protein
VAAAYLKPKLTYSLLIKAGDILHNNRCTAGYVCLHEHEKIN